MGQIDRAGTFRGNIVEHAVSTTTNGFPQFVCKLIATEIWDEDEKIWVDWSEYDVNEITAYLVLFGSAGETLNCQQIKKALNWDGLSFLGLDAGDYSEVKIQFRVVEHTYEEKTRLQVEWIDEYDAAPGSVVRKLDPAEIRKLDAKYAQYLKAANVKKAPVKAKAKNPGTVKVKGTKPTSPKGPVKQKVPTVPPVQDISQEGQCTKQEAWDEVVKRRASDKTDEDLAKSWLEAVHIIGEGKSQDELTDTEWFAVKTRVVDETGDPNIPF